MTRVSFDIDPRVLSKLRALANRRGVTVDIVVGEFLSSAIRSPAPKRPSVGDPQAEMDSRRQAFGLIDVAYPDDDAMDDDAGS